MADALLEIYAKSHAFYAMDKYLIVYLLISFITDENLLSQCLHNIIVRCAFLSFILQSR